VLKHAEKVGNARKACRYFGVGRSSFYRWRDAYQKHGKAGLKCAKSIPKNPANQTPAEIVEKVLYLRRKYHLGSIRIVWYLARYYGIISKWTLSVGPSNAKIGEKVRRFQFTAIAPSRDIALQCPAGKWMRPGLAPSRSTRNIRRQTRSTSLTIA